MKLSIVTVCLNVLEDLKTTLQSLKLQSSWDFEWVVIDGCSTDGTLEFLQNLKVPFKVRWISEKDAGIYNAMNKSLQIAEGDFVWFLNAGDTAFSPLTVSQICTSIDSYPFADLIYGKAQFLTEFGPRAVGRVVEAHHFLADMPLCHQALIFKRSTHLHFPYLEEFRLISDWIYVRMLFLEGFETQFVPWTICKYNVEGISSVQHFKVLWEKWSYVSSRSFVEKMAVIFQIGVKFVSIRFLKALRLYRPIKLLQHRFFVRPE